jgi:NAD(P)-dependent dehydrogenase (short-subunit alcohol dehydrogenase family)
VETPTSQVSPGAGAGGSLAGLGVVVTGGGSGIGAALVRRFAAGGARVVVADIHGSTARAMAEEVGGLAVPGDATSNGAVARLVSLAREHLGEIDLFCANAGIGTAGGPEAPDAAWQRAWDVNVMGHVHAARHLLPRWLERGHGHLLATVSAAGLLTMPGAAPYAVTKHAALAFAEWLAVTYGSRGIRVQALCPQGVHTPLLEATGTVGRVVLAGSAISPQEVAEVVVRGLAHGPFLVLPHPEVAGYHAAKAADPDAWITSMRRVQARVDAAVAAEVTGPPGEGGAVAGPG